MINEDIYNTKKKSSWCTGCGNFPLRKSLKEALKEMDLQPHQVIMSTGIGQAAKMPHYFKVNGFNGLHGRSLPPAVGMKIANPELKVIVESGDGCTYGEGGNHFIHNIRRNLDITHLVHNNQIYGLTKGQASPTSERSLTTSIQTEGINAEPFNPVLAALGMEASFIARGFVGEAKHLKSLIKAALKWKGYALIDILQPCISFNKINTYQWYKDRVYKLNNDYNPEDYTKAVEKAREWGDKIPIGIIYQSKKETFRDRISHLDGIYPGIKSNKPRNIEKLYKEFQ